MSLTVTAVDLYLARLDLVHDFETSSHRKGFIEHILVRATATHPDGTLVGWGECASPSDPYYCSETTGSSWQVLENYFVPLILGHPWETPQEAASLTRAVTGNQFARAGIEMALWDLFGQSRRLPLARLLTDRPATQVEAGVSLGIEQSIDDLLAQVERQVAAGYRRVKLKIRPGWDIEPARAVRSAFPRLVLQVDANAAYAPATADLLTPLDDLGLLMIEQPFAAEDLLAHAALSQRLETPLCLDESITSLGMLQAALALEACSVVNIKVSRLGGIEPARQVHQACVDVGLPVWCGGMHEFGIGRAANLAVASLPGFTLPSDVSGSDKYYQRDVVLRPARAVSGKVAVPLEQPGLGVAVDEAMLQDPTVVTRTCSFGSTTTTT